MSRLDWSPNQITIQAEGPGVLALSEIDYPGWEVRLDGELWDRYNGLGVFRSLTLPAGTHVVEFLFRPVSIYVGFFLAGIRVS